MPDPKGDRMSATRRAAPALAESRHPSAPQAPAQPAGANLLFADGSVHFITPSIDAFSFAAIFTARGNETGVNTSFLE